MLYLYMKIIISLILLGGSALFSLPVGGSIRGSNRVDEVLHSPHAKRHLGRCRILMLGSGVLLGRTLNAKILQAWGNTVIVLTMETVPSMV